MKITKRIAKEVHNEKQKSFDEGLEQGVKSEKEKILKLVEEFISENSLNLSDYSKGKFRELKSEIENEK